MGEGRGEGNGSSLRLWLGSCVCVHGPSPDRAFVALGVGGEPSGEIYLFSTKKGRLVGHSKVRRRRWAQSVVQGATDRQGEISESGCAARKTGG